MEYEDYSAQQLTTVFWDFNRKNNNYLDNIYEKYINNINSIDISDMDDKEKTNEYLKIINDYELFIAKINGLRECLDKLFEGSNIKKIDNYDTEFIKKIQYIHIELCKKTEINLSIDKFTEFMYKNTPEGRIIEQNRTASTLLNDIKNVEDFIFKIKSKIKSIIAQSKDTTTDIIDNDAENDINSDDKTSDNEEYDNTSDNEPDNKSSGSLSD